MERKFKNVPEDKQAAEFLANERTFLAWIRTSVAVISMGFVVAKFHPWLQEAVAADSAITHPPSGASLQIGIGMMAMGGLLALMASWRYHVVNGQIEQGKVTADRGLIIFVTSLVTILAGVMIFAMLTTRGK